jgi:urease accessory protein
MKTRAPEGADVSPHAATPFASMLALVRLLQLASPTLPLGAFSYSQGLEAAVEARIVHDAATAEAWIGDLMTALIAPGEAAVFVRLRRALAAADDDAFVSWNAWFRASRETRELRAETEQMGAALVAVMRELSLLEARDDALIARAAPIVLPAAYALASHRMAIDTEAALAGYLWSWLDNQVLAAMKTVPLGQRAGQRMLFALGARIPDVIADALSLEDDDVTSFAPGLSLASSRHETQYSRLFRS